MRILFAGSPAIAVPCLETLVNMKEIELAGILTNPDAPKGRHGKPAPTEVGEAAEKLRLNISVLKPQKLDAEVRELVASLNCDLLVTFAYGHIFGPKFLALFPLGGINVHPSLLPKYRGPSPIQAAILNRESETGISIQTIAAEVDSGDILAQEKFELNGDETTASLSVTAGEKAALMLPQVLRDIAAGTAKGKPQDHSEASYCSFFSKEDGIIDWKTSALQIDAKIRAFTPWPLCRTIHNGKELLILKASVYGGCAQGDLDKDPGKVLDVDKQYGILVKTGDGILAVTELQYQQKKALFWRDFLNGARDFPGAQLI